MTRRDSLGMAAKEFTENMVGERRSVQSSNATNTDGAKSMTDKQVFTEGTFAEQVAIGNIDHEQEEDSKYEIDNRV